VLRLPSSDDPALILERVPGSDARGLFLTGRTGEAYPLVEHAVRFAFGTLAQLADAPARASPALWCVRHLRASLSAATQRHSELTTLLDVPRLAMADCTLPNPLYNNAEHAMALLCRIDTSRLRITHGDLHLGNIIVAPDRESFHLVDPRGGWDGQRCFDPAYDIAKLLHEPHYVAARSGQARVHLGVLAGSVVVTPAATPGEMSALTVSSSRLASIGCRSRIYDDPLVAARATMLTGILLLSPLRLDNIGSQEWETLLGHGLCWLAAGVHAVSQGLGLGRCEVLWEALLSHLVPDGWSSSSIGRWLDQD
jgi:streptomycin 6-kinase